MFEFFWSLGLKDLDLFGRWSATSTRDAVKKVFFSQFFLILLR